ncbi:Glycine decarboxlase L-protein (GDC-L) [Chara braunii]|uniref:Dihydrolipoyl dehydrogenase n=1 Tax=Chara braunii TaxID=69332 RepID=A0A388K5H6_CHABU|nr:Glycine decarboxlase L-protein (GDC-L) [Chara braunii]|eukprot:GBG65266.1 Glycine decarboxlase L-protein (GDC-L) [Chara braunii]
MGSQATAHFFQSARQFHRIGGVIGWKCSPAAAAAAVRALREAGGGGNDAHRPVAAAVAAMRGTGGRSFASAAAKVNEEADVVVIGGGPGGYVAAIKAGQLGFKTTCVEKRGSLGGTCLNVGCIPSKALLQSSHMYHDAKSRFANHGVQVSGLEIDVAKMMKQKEQAVFGLTKGIEGLFKKNSVGYVKGEAALTSPNEVKVQLTEGGEKSIGAKHIIIATGSDVRQVPGVPIDEQKIVSSTGALELKKVPKKMVVIGGGYIGLEMGSVWGRLGSEVTVVEFADSIVPGMDGEVRRAFQRTLEKQKMKFKLKTKVVGVDTSGDGVVLFLEPAGGGAQEQFQADVVLVSVGRVPYTTNLGLEQLGIKTDQWGRIEVDDHFRTNVPSVYAIGDVIPGPMLAHKAEEDGVACVELLAGKAGHVDYNTVPGIVYTHPEVAMVGKTEEELKAAGVEYRAGKFPFLANSRARTIEDADGLVKILADKKTDKILGVHVMGPNAGELIMEGVLAMQYGGASEDIARTCHGHPTLSEAIKEAAMATYDKPIHI